MHPVRISSTQRGFTLVEVMIVVAIIGILSAIVIPAARDYAIRAKMSEVMLAFATCREAISEVYQAGESSPGPNNWGCEESTTSQYVLAVNTTDEGTIKIAITGFGDLRIDTQDVTLAPLDFQGARPVVGESRIAQWRCGSSADGTTLRINYLPGNCRG
jgi:type IV pilus assembly protein PilA